MKHTSKFQWRLDLVTFAKVVKDSQWGDLRIQLFTDVGSELTKGKKLWQRAGSSNSWYGVTRDGACMKTLMHSGMNNACEGGFGGQPFEITLVDGSHKVMCGPWSSRPGVHMWNGVPDHLQVTVKYGILGIALRGEQEEATFSREFVEAVINKFNLDVYLDKFVHVNPHDAEFYGKDHPETLKSREYHIEIRNAKVN